MQEIINDLNKLDREIESAKKELGVFEGENKQLFKQAEESLGLSSMDEMEDFVKKNTKKLYSLKIEINTLYKELKTEYEW
ncbi:MAG: hypothetical protein GQ540_03830 [Lutibacter sp.]|uniref:hypothetical protein n=1 Tax=Lutibacter sp. TaxID=1925666 RepID=UPI0019F4CB4B|nr:hypothetical protein [Lutibacter sp.]NOR27643.1 hypothetical protein [Lutibacter sp.]